MPVVEVEHVVKRFAAVTAVNDVSLELRRGEILSVLGPNGAGKTSLVRMLVGIFRPDSGRIVHHITGAPTAEPPRQTLGYLPEERGLYQDMPVLRTLTYFGALHGLSRAAASRSALTWLERLGLSTRTADNVKTLSKGNQQKVQFVAAVVHAPRLVILDEPFSGLDPLNQELFIQLIRELRDAGATVLLNAHQMSLVERLADRVVLMSQGRIVLQGTIPELRRKWHAGERLVLGVKAGADTSFLASHAAVEEIEHAENGDLRVRLRKGADLGPLLRDIGERLGVTSVRSEDVTLHEIYVQTVGATSTASAGETEE